MNKKKSPKTRIEHAQSLASKPKGGKQASEDGFDRSKPHTLASQLDKWLSYMEQRNYSQRTLEMIRWTLRSFLVWCHARDLIDPKQFKKSHLESFQRWLFRYRQADGKPLSIRTQRQRLGSIQRFFAYLCKNNHIDANPASDLDLPRQPSRLLPKGLPMDELTRLLESPDTRDPLGIRDRALLETLYATGIRRTELVQIELQDLDPKSQTLHIREGKGGKSRLVPIGQQALAKCLIINGLRRSLQCQFAGEFD
jgi:integrase/recombinase XerD